MKFSAVHSKKYWESQKNKEYLESNEEYYEFPKEYEWMIERMKERIPGYAGEYLMWMWVGEAPLYESWTSENANDFVVLEIELDEGLVLISDFDAWTLYALNNWKIPDALETEEDVELSEGYSQEEIENSWKKIFNLGECLKNPHIHTNVDEYRVLHQATTDRIPISCVKSVRELQVL